MQEKSTLSVPELQRLLVAAAQNLPATEDVVDVTITPRGEGETRDWALAHWQSTGSHAAAVELRSVANRLRQVFAVTVSGAPGPPPSFAGEKAGNLFVPGASNTPKRSFTRRPRAGRPTTTIGGVGHAGCGYA